MMRRTLLALLMPLLLAACATGKNFSEMAQAIPAVPPDKGRIYIYRTAVLGMAVQPSVKVNDEVVGSAVPRGFFYVDRPPSDYRISTATEVERTLSLTLEPGQVRYVRLAIAMGFFVGHVFPELVEDSTGQAEIADCRYTGT